MVAVSLAAGLIVCVPSPAAAVTFSNPAPITIPSKGTATPYPSQIAVSGVRGTTADIKVTLTNFSHTYAGDVAIVLVPPRGTSVLLMNLFLNGSGAGPTSNANITFDGAAAGLLPATGPVTTGSYKPTAYSLAYASFSAPGPATNFCNPGPTLGGGLPCTNPVGGNAFVGALRGFNPNGTWSLYVVDTANDDAGEIAGGWSLDINGGGGPERSVVVGKEGTGTGTVTSDVNGGGNGITCGADCAEAYADGTSVTLTATPSANSSISGWRGCDRTTATTCTVSVNAARDVSATFDLRPSQTLSVVKMGSAANAGNVTSSPTGIDCGADCTKDYPGGTTVVLSAYAPLGSVFSGFTGCDRATSTACTVSISALRQITATFTAVPVRHLTVSRDGTGAGLVTGQGIHCGTDCAEAYNDGTSVVLIARPSAPGSMFAAWAGCDSVPTNTCAVTMTSDRVLSATFTQGHTIPLAGSGSGAAPGAGGGPQGAAPAATPHTSRGHPVDPLELETARARGLRRCLATAAHGAKRQRSRARRACLTRYARTPGRVSGLHARALSNTAVLLSFAAPGSDGSHPPAARGYLLKQSPGPIRSARDFRRAQTLCNGNCHFAVTAVGARVTLTITHLLPHSTYYYAIAALDNLSNRFGPRSPTAQIRTR